MNTDLSAVVGTWLTLAAAAAGLVTGLVGFWLGIRRERQVRILVKNSTESRPYVRAWSTAATRHEDLHLTIFNGSTTSVGVQSVRVDLRTDLEPLLDAAIRIKEMPAASVAAKHATRMVLNGQSVSDYITWLTGGEVDPPYYYRFYVQLGSGRLIRTQWMLLPNQRSVFAPTSRALGPSLPSADGFVKRAFAVQAGGVS